MIDLPAPARTFLSDNAAGALDEVMAALVAANAGHTLPYQEDPWSESARQLFRDLFDAPVEVAFCYGGTGANLVGLQTLVGPFHSIVCSRWAHINVDEAGAAERLLGVKLIDVGSADAKVTVDHLEEAAGLLGSVHAAQPRVVSITQPTELGTLYTVDEIGTLAERAHRHGMAVHLDGARIANAAAVLGDVRSFTIDAGVDVLSFGGTKNGLLYGDAVVWLDPALGPAGRWSQKQFAQLASKSRFIAAQFSALLADGLWLRAATHANTMATRLDAGLRSISEVQIPRATEVNSVWPRLDPAALTELESWTPFVVWDDTTNEVRFMCAWDVEPDDVDRLVAGIRFAVDAAS